MKRLLEDVSHAIQKLHAEKWMRTNAITLIDLPDSVLERIWSYLDIGDIKNVSLVHSSYREALIPYIFANVGVTWPQLHEILEDSVLRKYRHHIKSINIIKSDSQREYTENIFGELVSHEKYPNLTAVSINSMSSSYWLRYNKCEHIRQLELYTSADPRGTRIFNLTHVKHFQALRSLTLHDYNFMDSDDENALPRLYRLSIHNCEWNFPFDLTKFNIHNTLTELSVSYSNDNQFVVSERFRDFLSSPLSGHSSSIRTLRIAISNSSENRRILLANVLRSILDSFSELENLSLVGWAATISHVRQLLESRSFHNPMKFNLEVRALDSDLKSIPKQIAKIQHIENLNFSLSLID
ncbi:hypothetical protein CJJ07_003418 [Candidozyma auris]|nr:hypothetical protein CJJ07_003418 [[Candida] auris]QEL61315.1 hypothetical protein CJJ09_003454 [[Candida] auris]